MRPSIWSINGCTTFISEEDIGEICFVIPFCPFHSLSFMYFAEKRPFLGAGVPMDWSILQRVVFSTFGPDAASKIDLLLEWGILRHLSLEITEISRRKYFQMRSFESFSRNFSRKNKCLNCSMVPTHNSRNIDGSSSLAKQ